MALTRAKAREAFDYVVNVVFQVSKEGPLYRALEKSGDTDIRDMISLRNPDIESLTYDRSDTEKGIPLMRGDKNLLCIFQYYILYRHSIGDPIGQDFWSISTEDFEDYRLGHYLTTLADFEPEPPASTAQDSLQFRLRQYSTVDQAHAQDFVEDPDPGYTTRTQEERYMQMEGNFLTSNLSQDAIESIPTSTSEDVPSPSPDHAFAISEDDPCIESLGGEILSNPPNYSIQDLASPTPQDLMDTLLPSARAGLLKNLLIPAMLYSSLPSFKCMPSPPWPKLFLATYLQLLCKLVLLCRRKLDLMVFWLISIAQMRMVMMTPFLSHQNHFLIL